MRKPFFVLLFLFSSYLSAENPFFITHNLGKISAKKAASKNYPHLRNSLKTILLKELDLTLEKERRLKSDLALIDLETKKINFFSLGHTIRLESLASGNLPSFCLSAQKAEFSTQKPTLKNALENKIVFQEKVQLQISEKFSIVADTAEYTSDKIILFGDKNSCRFQGSDKTILSKKVSFDLKHGALFLEDVYGQLKNIPLKEDEVINLSSGKLTILNQGKKILLQEGVKITHTGGAEIACDSLELTYLNKKLAKIVTSTNAKVSFQTPAPAIFTSLGPITIDLVNKTIDTAEEGIVYKEKDTLIVAKKAYLKFKDIKNLSDIENIILEKEVHFFSSKLKNKNNLGLADRLSFDLATKTLTLESLPSKKVVFWEEASSLALSADKIQIQKGAKKAIKGFGNVRFSLKKDEEQLFEKTLRKYLLER